MVNGIYQKWLIGLTIGGEKAVKEVDNFSGPHDRAAPLGNLPLESKENMWVAKFCRAKPEIINSIKQ